MPNRALNSLPPRLGVICLHVDQSYVQRADFIDTNTEAPCFSRFSNTKGAEPILHLGGLSTFSTRKDPPMTHRSATSALCLSVVAVTALSASTSFAAGDRHIHASACQAVSGTATFNIYGQIQNTGTTTLVLWCPLITDPSVSIPASSYSTYGLVTVDGWTDVYPGVDANVCVESPNGGSAFCGYNLPATTYSIGLYHLDPEVPPRAANDYLFLRLYLRPGTVFFGYKIHQ
jgi:hypothetical protein